MELVPLIFTDAKPGDASAKSLSFNFRSSICNNYNLLRKWKTVLIKCYFPHPSSSENQKK